MCTRFYTERDDPELSAIGEAALNSSLAQRFYRAEGSVILMKGEICPTDIVPVIACSMSGNQTVFPMKWGFNIPIEHKAVAKTTCFDTMQLLAFSTSARVQESNGFHLFIERNAIPSGRSCH